MSATLNITQAQPLTQLTLAFGSISGTYALVGSFPQGVVWMQITSTLNGLAQISFDGTNNHIAVPSGSTTPVFIQIPFKAFRTIFQNPNIYVNSAATLSSGSIYISAFGSTAQST